jgi:hypothetical protein
MSAAREPAQKAYGKEHDNDLDPAREYQADNGREYEYSKELQYTDQAVCNHSYIFFILTKRSADGCGDFFC